MLAGAPSAQLSIAVAGLRPSYGPREVPKLRGACSAEGECESFRAGVEKLDFKLSIGDGAGLPDQLVEPLLGKGAVPVLVDVTAVRCAGRLSIEPHTKAYRRTESCRTHNEIYIATVETVNDCTIRLVERDPLALYRPVARQRPLVPVQCCRRLIRPRLVGSGSTGRRKVPGL